MPTGRKHNDNATDVNRKWQQEIWFNIYEIYFLITSNYKLHKQNQLGTSFE